MAEKVLEVNNLKKQFGDIIAVDDVSFSVKAGEIVGLLGPNGAGKTTTINMVLGTLEPSSGSVIVKGMNIAEHRSEVLSQMNFAPAYRVFYLCLSG
ncbi:MAG: ATP-binding cassette domain-containing protein [Candidatus Omnitrophica bacterium]|nr:ATP-binding cassette domain-containing protein [Candidatus Omnitrophota bacterium]